MGDLSKLERMMRTKILNDTFKQIKTHAEWRAESNGNDKFEGVVDIHRMIMQSYMTGLQHAFSTWKNNCRQKVSKDARLKTLFGRFFNRQVRDAFNNWKWAHQRAECLDDNYFAGPERAEYWEAQREIENL